MMTACRSCQGDRVGIHSEEPRMGVSSAGMTIAMASEVGALLGWSGWPTQACVLGTPPLTVFMALDEREHQRRVIDGLSPVADPIMLRCVANQNPGFMTRPAPIRVDGAVVSRRRWTSARSALGGFVAFGPGLALLPASEACRLSVATNAIFAGFGVAAEQASGVEIVHQPDTRPVARRTWVHRLVEEILYSAFLDKQSQADADRVGPRIPVTGHTSS
jgi:hypothetical protein